MVVFGSMKAYPFRPERQRQEMVLAWNGSFFPMAAMAAMGIA